MVSFCPQRQINESISKNDASQWEKLLSYEALTDLTNCDLRVLLNMSGRYIALKYFMYL